MDQTEPNRSNQTELTKVDQIGPKWIEVDQTKPNRLSGLKYAKMDHMPICNQHGQDCAMIQTQILTSKIIKY